MAIPPVSLQSPLDQKSLALLLQLKNDPSVQANKDLFEMINRAVAFMMPAAAPAPALMFEALPLVPFLRIDMSGKDGENGFPGTAASSPGGMGVHGKDGTSGAPGRNIRLQLAVKEGLVIAQWEYGSATLKVDDPASSIHLRAVGGRGARGGNGGRGGNGLQGTRGRDATRFSPGGDGERGRLGGAGGAGGHGGHGGKAGDVSVHVSPEDADLLLLLKTPEIAGGVGGKGGSGGPGGQGGRGGVGGNSLSWNESVLENRQETRQEYNSFTKRYETKFYTKTVTVLKPRFMPGGSQGPQGENGNSGSQGIEGTPGLNGPFQMTVGGTSFHRLYDLAVIAEKIGKQDDFVEPGETVQLKMSAANTGGMPTPRQNIEISLQPAFWMEAGKPVVLIDPLPVDGSIAIRECLTFCVKNVPATEEPYIKKENLMYQAVLCRVNRSFANVSRQKDLFTVRHPVQISPMQGKRLLEHDEKTEVRVTIQNISSVDLGRQKRRVFVIFEAAQLEYLQSSDFELSKTLEADQQENNRVTSDIEELPAKSEVVRTVALRFLNPHLSNQSRLVLVASLLLQDFEHRAHCIQRRTFEIQFKDKTQPQPEEIVEHPLK